MALREWFRDSGNFELQDIPDDNTDRHRACQPGYEGTLSRVQDLETRYRREEIVGPYDRECPTRKRIRQVSLNDQNDNKYDEIQTRVPGEGNLW